MLQGAVFAALSDAGRAKEIDARPIDETAFERMPEPKPGDWLSVFPEKQQSFAEYVASRPRRLRKSRKRIYIRPFEPRREAGIASGERKKLLKALEKYGEAFFTGADCVLLEALPAPEERYVSSRTQYSANGVLADIARKLPRDAAATVGLMFEDLFAHVRGRRPLNFVFGLGSYGERAAVFSVLRYSYHYPGEPGETTLLKRACKVFAHEVGHVFGLPHCVEYRCAMNGSNSLPESDARPMHLCPVCLKKLEWNLAFDRHERCRGLERFYRSHGMKKEMEFCRMRAQEEAGR